MCDFDFEEQGPTKDEPDCTGNEPLNCVNKIGTAPVEQVAGHENFPEIRPIDGDEENKRQESKKIAAVIVRGNPNIAYLSDAYRPIKIAEGFSELYDNEWTDAYEELIKTFSEADNEAIQLLLGFVQSAFRRCAREAERQLSVMHRHFQVILKEDKSTNSFVQNIPNTGNTERGAYSVLSQIRKPYGELMIDGLQKKMTGIKQYKSKVVEKYGQTAVKLCWWMCLQDPPVYMCTTDDKDEFNVVFYRAYTKSGSQLDYIVWPALRLYKDGPLLYRGVAQFK
ncbi:hypothetical protein DPMN_106868 [Dreissena polymorpha]|nr:hypothetical protein DPMN_106868 [Dreissena polymorpha]